MALTYTGPLPRPSLWEDGKLRRLGRVDMRRNFLAAFAATLSPEDIVVVEATGNAAAVAGVIGPHVKRVVIANPLQVRMIAHAKIKTDTIDAGVLAQLYASGFLPEVWIPDETTQALRRQVNRGEIAHKGNSYLGEQPAIVDKPLWDDVHAVLAANRVERTTGARANHPSLLTCMVFDETGERLTPTYAVKKGTRYWYYVSTSLITGAGRTRSSSRRIPAGNLEGLVINRLRTFLADPGAILDAVDYELSRGPGRSQLIERSRQIAEELGSQARDEVKAMLMALLCRVEIRSDRVDISLSRGRLTQLLAGSPDLKMQQAPRRRHSQ